MVQEVWQETDPVRRPEHVARAWSIRRLLVGAAMSLVVACGANRRDFVDKRLDTLDLAYSQRGDDKQLENALRGYLQLNERFPGDRRVLGRLARAYTVRAELSQGDDALRDFGTAREFGLECLMQQGSFAGLVVANGGLVVPAAARELNEEDVGCLVWTVVAWSRWIHERGAAGVGLDHKVLISLASRAVELDPRWGRGRVQYALGLAHALPPDVLEPKLGKAKGAFEEAMAVAPDRLSVQVDYAHLVLRRMGAVDEADAMLRKVSDIVVSDDEADRVENIAAIAEARKLLGLPPLVDVLEAEAAAAEEPDAPEPAAEQ